MLPFEDRINRISSQDPWLWLAAGWRDLRRAWSHSLPYGLLFVGLGYGVTVGLYQIGMSYMIWPMAAGFILIAPIMCAGFYEISRCLETGQRVTWGHVCAAWCKHARSVFGAGLALVFFMILWIRSAALIYVINFPYTGLSIQEMANHTFFTIDGLTFLAAGSVIGGVLALGAFLVSAVSLQTMIGQNADFVPAVLISVFSVSRNFGPMMLWALIIVAITTLGLVTAFIGLAITLPLIGHASWHAYRAVVNVPGEAAGGANSP